MKNESMKAIEIIFPGRKCIGKIAILDYWETERMGKLSLPGHAISQTRQAGGNEAVK